MVNRYKTVKVDCHLQFPFGAVGDMIIFADELKYGKRLFQINAILVDINDKEEQN